MIGFDEALALAGASGRLLGIEQVPLSEAHRRVLAEPVVAAVASPPADVSSMDGYAVREADLADLPSTLPVAGESLAGRPFAGPLPPRTCVRIFTGAAVPAGADRVVVQEVVERGGAAARFTQGMSPARFIRPAGSDLRVGDQVLRAGTLLTPRALVAAAGADAGHLPVARRPLVRLLSTGDELVEPGTARTSVHLIPESVGVGVAALAAEWGGRVERALRLPDDLVTMEQAAAEALAAVDLVVVTGGASVGEKDFAKAMFAPHRLELIFSKVAIKPGKPAWLGRARGKLVLGLPGNPTSALVTARLFLAPILCALTGRSPAEAIGWRTLPLASASAPVGDRETFARGFIEDGAVHLLGHQDSSAQKVLAQAGLLIRLLPGDQPVAAGTQVQVMEF